MKLYSGTSAQFTQDTVQNQIADKIQAAYTDYYGHRPSPSEYASWTNSLQFLKNTIEAAGLSDNMIILEYELPYSNCRIDCLIFGNGDYGANVVLIELKQWSATRNSGVAGNVLTFVGGAERMQSHPALQVQSYQDHISDFIQTFEEQPPLGLSACVYLHNYAKKEDDALFAEEYESLVEKFPLFTKQDFAQFGDYLKTRLAKGNGLEIFNRFIQSSVRPSKKLLEHTKTMMHGQNMFHLIDEQLTANNAIIDRAKKASTLKRKSIIIVRGGPGTGKSVIALNVLSELLSKGLMVFHATGSSAFTKTLRKIVGTRVAKLFKFFDSFMKVQENQIDVLICDEAHRIRKTSSSRYRGKSTLPQIEELLRAAKVCVFFIDDYQIVRPTEIGSVDLIKTAATKLNAEIFDFELKTQFRCSGSDGYLNWIDDVLGIRDTANKFLTANEKMEFKIFETPQALYEAIKLKNKQKSNSARLVAGFCWPWSDPNPDGTLKEDVVIGDFKMPWEAKEYAKKLAPGIPIAPLWAYDPAGVNQLGSIYTIQGFEFDYVGVIVGKDLIYDQDKKTWIGLSENSADPSVKRAKEDFVKYVKNVYRVLMTRGMKGCYVYFLDKNTENYFRSRLSNSIQA
jgi:hypothetical protein